MHDPDLERAVRSIKRGRQSGRSRVEARARRKKLRKNPDAKCVNCRRQAQHECTACYRFICTPCAMRLGSRRFCSENCVRELHQLESAVRAGEEVNRARELRMWIADPWGIDLYRRLFRGGVIVGTALFLWYSFTLLVDSRQSRDIRDRGLRHGLTIQDVPVGKR